MTAVAEAPAGITRRRRRRSWEPAAAAFVGPSLLLAAAFLLLPMALAFVYSFARTKTGVAQTLAVVSSGKSTYTVNAVVQPGTPVTAKQVGAMLGTFDVPARQ